MLLRQVLHLLGLANERKPPSSSLWDSTTTVSDPLTLLTPESAYRIPVSLGTNDLVNDTSLVSNGAVLKEAQLLLLTLTPESSTTV